MFKAVQGVVAVRGVASRAASTFNPLTVSFKGKRAVVTGASGGKPVRARIPVQHTHTHTEHPHHTFGRYRPDVRDHPCRVRRRGHRCRAQCRQAQGAHKAGELSVISSCGVLLLLTRSLFFAPQHSNIKPLALDLSKIEASRKELEKIGDIDLLVNNAGIANLTDFLHVSSKDFHECVSSALTLSPSHPLTLSRTF